MARKSRKHIEENTVQEMDLSPQKTLLPTAAYVRLSVENSGHEDDDTLQTQITLVHDFVKKHPDLTLADTYADNGYTGTNFERPEFERLMEDVRRGRIQCIVVKDFSRFGRDYLETGLYIETVFPRLNVRFIAVTDDFDSARPDAMESIAIPLKNMINSLYAKDISKKMASVNADKTRRGEILGGQAPYGMRFTEGHRYEPDEKTVPYVRMMFLWRMLGAKRHDIVDRLNFLQAPTPGQCKERETAGESYIWRANAVGRILSNPVYAGDTAIGKTRQALYRGMKPTAVNREDWAVFEDTHKAVVLRSDFEEVWEMEEEIRRVRHEARKAGAKRLENLPGLFSGMVYCGECGSQMRVEHQGHYADELSFNIYICKVGRKKSACSEHFIEEKKLQILVMDQVCLFIQAMCSRKEMLQEMTEGNTDKNRLLSLKKKEAFLKGQLAQVEERKALLYEDFADGVLDKLEYQGMKEHYIAQIQEYQERLREAAAQRQKTEGSIQKYLARIADMEQFLGNRTFNMDLIKALVERIEIAMDGSMTVRFKCDDAYEELIQALQQPGDGEEGD